MPETRQCGYRATPRYHAKTSNHPSPPHRRAACRTFDASRVTHCCAPPTLGAVARYSCATMAGALHPGIASFIDSAILVAANGIRPVLPNAAVTAFTLGYTALVIGLVFAVAQAVRYIQVLLPTTGAWIAVVVPCSLYAFWRPGRRGISFWLWLVYLGIVLPIVPCGGAAVALARPQPLSLPPQPHWQSKASVASIPIGCDRKSGGIRNRCGAGL